MQSEKPDNTPENLPSEFTLASLLEVINNAPDIKSIKQTLAKQIQDIFQVEMAAIFLVNKQKQELTSWLLLPKTSTEKIVIPIETNSIVGYVAAKKEAVNLGDAYNPMELRRIGPELNFSDSFDKNANIRSKQILAVPVQHGGTVLAVIELINKKDDTSFTYEDQNAVSELGKILATAFLIHSNLGAQAYPKYEPLLAQKLLSRKELVQGLNKAIELREDPDTVLMDTFQIPKLKMGELLAKFYSTGFTDLTELDNNPTQLFQGANLDYFEQEDLVPFSLNDGKLIVAATNIEDENLSSAIQKQIPGADQVELLFAFKEDVRSYWIQTRTKKTNTSVRVSEKPKSSFDSSIFDLLDDDEPQRQDFDLLYDDEPQNSSYDLLDDYEPQGSNLERPDDNKPQRSPSNRSHFDTPQRQIKETRVTVVERRAKPRKDLEDFGDINEPSVVQLVNKILESGFTSQASDIHIEPYGTTKNGEVRHRINGACSNALIIPPQYVRQVVDRIKTLASLKVFERSRPQEGRLKFTTSEGEEIELRVATLPTANGNEDVVLRFLPSPVSNLSLDEIIPAKIVTPLKEIIEQEQGLILAVGPSLSGKTTTLHSALNHINTSDKKIWTAEYPVEIQQHRIRQIQVDPLKNFTFAAALQAILKADPDVIMISDMHDLQTATMAVDAAMNGHLLLSSLSVNSAAEGIIHCLNMGLNPMHLATALQGVLAQRLVRTLCVHCREPYHPEKAEFDKLLESYGVSFFDHINVMYGDNLVFHRAIGCPQCNDSGYHGRTGLHELLVVTPQLRNLITKRASLADIIDEAMINDMTLLVQEGIQLIFEGTIDYKELMSVCAL